MSAGQAALGRGLTEAGYAAANNLTTQTFVDALVKKMQHQTAHITNLSERTLIVASRVLGEVPQRADTRDAHSPRDYSGNLGEVDSLIDDVDFQLHNLEVSLKRLESL